MLELRAIAPDDWQLWRDLRLAALADASAAFGSRLADWQGADERRWRQRLDIPGHHILAVRDGVPVGMASGVPSATAGVAELISMFVSPDVRGQGVGDRLITAVLDWARSTGAQSVRLNVAEGNTAAATLYRRHGFRETGLAPEPAPDGSRHEWTMIRPVDVASPAG